MNDQAEGGYTDLFEVICPDCGDHLGLDYSRSRPGFSGLRGPRPLKASLAVYERHLGLIR